MLKKVNALCYFLLPGMVLAALYWGDFSEYPQYIHAWANYDYLALAHGFINNGFDFFHPQTYVLNPQFPDNFSVPRSGITSVDFPINAYLVGVLMYIFDTKSTAIFYGYQWVYLVVGIGFSGLLFERIAKNNIIPWVGIVFMFSSTVFIYYSHSFLPSITALSNVFIGLYFFHKYYSEKRKVNLIVGLFFLTIAGLTRTPFSIPLIALSAVALLNIFCKNKTNKPLMVGLISSLSLIGGYFTYNNYLRTNYGSMFLGSIKPVKSLETLSAICQHIYQKWFFEYFSITAQVVFAIVVVVFMAKLIIQRRIVGQTISNTCLFVCIYTIGVVLYSYLMFTQFYHHDYYFLDSFFIITTLIFVCTLSAIFKKFNHKLTYGIGIVLCLILVSESSSVNENISKRRTSYSWDVYQKSINNFIKNKAWFNSLNIPKDKNILVLNGYIPNALLSIFEQQGYVVLTTSKANIKRALTWGADYLLIQDTLFEKDIYNNYPGILSKLKKFETGNGISLYTMSKSLSDETISFNPFQGKTILNHLVIDTEVKINAEDIFSNTKTFEITSNQSMITLACNTHFDLTSAKQELYWVIEIIDNENKRVLYKALVLKPNENTLSEEIILELLPNQYNKPITVKSYFWNKKKTSGSYVYDFSIMASY
jgi:hypothetical protein